MAGWFSARQLVQEEWNQLARERHSASARDILKPSLETAQTEEELATLPTQLLATPQRADCPCGGSRESQGDLSVTCFSFTAPQ